MSCLGWAAGRGHTEVVKALIEKGAKVSSTDKVGSFKILISVCLIKKDYFNLAVLRKGSSYYQLAGLCIVDIVPQKL